MKASGNLKKITFAETVPGTLLLQDQKTNHLLISSKERIPHRFRTKSLFSSLLKLCWSFLFEGAIPLSLRSRLLSPERSLLPASLKGVMMDNLPINTQRRSSSGKEEIM